MLNVSNGDPKDPSLNALGATKVLLVEDEILIRLPVAEYLRTCDFQVIEASTGDEARQILLAGAPPDVLFSDVQLPGTMNGFELAEWVQDRFPQVKIIL